LKPESSEVELDLPIEMESSNIDREFANKYNVTKQVYFFITVIISMMSCTAFLHFYVVLQTAVSKVK